MSKLYDKVSSNISAIKQLGENGKVIYILNRGKVNRQIQIIAHSNLTDAIALPAKPTVSVDNNPEVSLSKGNYVSELEICLAPFKPTGAFNIVCTGQQYDIAFEIELDKEYYVKLDDLGNYTLMLGSQLESYFNDKAEYTAFTESSSPSITTLINCLPSDIGYNYEETLTTATNAGAILKYQVGENTPQVFKTPAGTDLGALNTTTFMNAFFSSLNSTTPNLKVRVETTTLETGEMVSNGITEYNFQVANKLGNHLLLEYGVVEGFITGMPATESNQVPRSIKFFAYTDSTYLSTPIGNRGGTGFVDVFPTLFIGQTAVEIHSCGTAVYVP